MYIYACACILYMLGGGDRLATGFHLSDFHLPCCLTGFSYFILRVSSLGLASLVPRLSPSQAYVDSLTFAPVLTFTQVQRSTNNYACVEEGEPGDAAKGWLYTYV